MMSSLGVIKLLGVIYFRADSRLAPSQWETALRSNAVSHWLAANLESALYFTNSHTPNLSSIGSVVELLRGRCSAVLFGIHHIKGVAQNYLQYVSAKDTIVLHLVLTMEVGFVALEEIYLKSIKSIIHLYPLYQVPSFEIMHRAWQYNCHALCKISKWWDDGNRCYGW